MTDSPAGSKRWVRLILLLAVVATAAVFVGLQLASHKGGASGPPLAAPSAGAPANAAPTAAPGGRAPSAATAPSPAEVGPLPPLAVRRLIHTAPVGWISYSPDGKTIATTGDDKLVRLWDAAAGTPLQSFDQGIYGRCVIFTPDGQALVCSFGDGNLHSIDRAKGIELRRFTGHEYPVSALALTPDGKTLLSLGMDHTIRAWDLAAGRQTQEMHPSEGITLVQSLAQSPDGLNVLAATGKRTLGVWEISTGRLLREVPLPGANPGANPGADADADAKKPELVMAARLTAMAGSSDGRLLALGTAAGLVYIVSPETGRPYSTIHGHAGEVAGLLFSPDGKTLAYRNQDDVIELLEAETGRHVLSLPGHMGVLYALAFSPDSRFLASATTDKTVVIWDLSLAAAAVKATTDAELEKCWGDLGGGDPRIDPRIDSEAAFAAGWAMTNAGDHAVAFLKSRLKPEVLDAAQVQTWVGQLDDADFNVRQTATAKLIQLGPAVGRAVRQAMEATGSEEVKDLARKILEKMTDPQPPRAQDRAIQILERIGSADAKALLQTLAGGGEGLRNTEDAKAALARLAARQR